MKFFFRDYYFNLPMLLNDCVQQVEKLSKIMDIEMCSIVNLYDKLIDDMIRLYNTISATNAQIGFMPKYRVAKESMFRNPERLKVSHLYGWRSIHDSKFENKVSSECSVSFSFPCIRMEYIFLPRPVKL